MEKIVAGNASGPVVAIKNADGVMVGMMKMAEDSRASGPLDALQRQLDDEMRLVDHDAAKRARERLVALADGGRLVVSWATPQELRDFEPRRVN
jgi:hypothetical protein